MVFTPRLSTKALNINVKTKTKIRKIFWRANGRILKRRIRECQMSNDIRPYISDAPLILSPPAANAFLAQRQYTFVWEHMGIRLYLNDEK
ncbi:uncharacterized protein ARMOST_14423 [Armillaria ostoyae]|uniref:Uncharacterized protein n=1 Tax=Armillaria ostoyae TaxID=47428 RepID=A0A284RQJ6_ARMOS|nr:uncharacterized protein ARMOST_14423 [Armillaria ostoyae]